MTERNLKPGERVALALYDAEAYANFNPCLGLTWREHCSIVNLMEKGLTANGFVVKRIHIDMEGYRKFLGEDLNTPEKRAQYLRMVTVSE